MSSLSARTARRRRIAFARACAAAILKGDALKPYVNRGGPTAGEEAVVVAFRRHTLLPLDDCPYGLHRRQ